MPKEVLYLFDMMFYNLYNDSQNGKGENKWQRISPWNTGLMMIGTSVC
jgi:hypothetical protein